MAKERDTVISERSPTVQEAEVLDEGRRVD